jgi:hypothetical protein
MDYAVSVLHASRITSRQTRSSESVTLFTSCCSIAASNGGRRLFFWVPELSPASATSFLQQELATTEPQRLSNWLTNTHQPSQLSLESYVTTDNQTARLSWKNKAPIWGHDQIFITVSQMRVCWCGTLSLTRGLVSRLQLLLDLASTVILGSESRRTRDHYFGVSNWVPFLSPPTTHRPTVEVFDHASTQENLVSWLTHCLAYKISAGTA